MKKLLSLIARAFQPKPVDHFAEMCRHQREADYHGHAGRAADARYHMGLARQHALALNRRELPEQENWRFV